MPKYRQIHTKIIDSFDFNEMPDDFTRVVWMLLPLILDSEGRGIDNVSWIKSKMFPLRLDVTDEAINKSKDWLSDRGMLVKYSVNGHNYFYIPKFKEYQSGTQKEAKSTLPTPELVESNSIPSQEKVSAAALYCIESELNCEEEKELFSNTSKLSELSKTFEIETGMPVRYQDRWMEAIRNMFHAGVTPQILKETIYKMKNPDKGGRVLPITGPWSCEGMAIDKTISNKGPDMGLRN